MTATDAPAVDFARAVSDAAGCDTLDTVLGWLDEVDDKAAGTQRRVLQQAGEGRDCHECPPGFLAALVDLRQVVLALRTAVQHAPAGDARVEWRVTGDPTVIIDGQPRRFPLYVFTYDDTSGRWDAQGGAEAAARRFVASVGPWADGPHLHRRVVHESPWEPVAPSTGGPRHAAEGDTVADFASVEMGDVALARLAAELQGRREA